MNIPASLQAHYDTGHTCMAVGLLLQRADGTTMGLTSLSVPRKIDITPWNSLPWNLAGLTSFEFSPLHGLTFGTLESTAGFEVDETSFVTLNNGQTFLEADLLAGRWFSARFRLFLFRWDVATTTIADDIETLKVGTMGQPKVESAKITMELRCLKQRLQQPIGIVSQPTCRARLFSTGSAQCNANPTGFRHNLTVTGVTDQGRFICSGAGQSVDYFGAGNVKWLTGNNAGIEMQVSSFASGAFVLTAPAVLAIQVGDTLIAEAGCRKRLGPDCRDKFGNVPNFQGEEHRPTADRILSGVGG